MWWKLLTIDLSINKIVKQCTNEIQQVVNCGVEYYVIYNYVYAKVALHTIQTTLLDAFVDENNHKGAAKKALVRVCDSYRITISEFDAIVDSHK